MTAALFDQPKPCRPLAVTMGDPAGVGLQTTLLAWMQRDAQSLKPFVVFGAPSAIAQHAGSLGLDVPIHECDAPWQGDEVFASALPVFPIAMNTPVQIGQSDPHHAAATCASIERAVEATIAGHCSGVVTNPVTKTTLTQSGFPHPGHTEFLGALAGALCPDVKTRAPVMMLVADELRVVPVTIHIPLHAVPAALTADLLQNTLRTVHTALQTDFALPHPRIAVAGLNPHAGEAGTLGHEDGAVIQPVLERLRAEGFLLDGPLPADTMFHDSARNLYDAAVCMYHDQALIPIKTLAFDRGVNVTLGLPFVRTSPDHGSALSIAGTDAVSPTSFIAALNRAMHIVDARAARHASVQSATNASRETAP